MYVLSRILIIGVLVLAVGAAVGRTALAFPGAAACPADSKNEVYVLPYARVDNAPCTCQTLLTCMNLDKQKDARVTVQFFSPSNPAAQAGVNAVRTLPPGEAGEFGTGDDPLGIKFLPEVTGSTGELTGRVCASSRRIACDAFLSCDCPAGAVWSPLKIILKKQKGD